MTTEEYDRWKDFSTRMAKTCFRKNRRPRADWILEQVESVFACAWDYDPEEVFTIQSWDHSGPYEDQRRETWKSWCGCDGRRIACGGDNQPKTDCRHCRGTGIGFDLRTGSLVCDTVRSHLSDDMPRCPRCKACEGSNLRTYQSDQCRCDDIDQLWYDQWSDQWGGPVCCCIRAGLDMACGPSAGVLGFTAGDLRRMFPEGVPDWCFPPGERLHYWLTDELNGTFAELPDDAQLVL